MNATAQTRRLPPRSDLAGEAMLFGLWALTAYHLVLALWMAAAPHGFFTTLGPFGAYNGHYVRDTATFEAALGIGFLVAVFRPAWRLPMLAITTVQFALHTVNHLVDADAAHPSWVGWFDFLSLLASTALLAAMLARTSRPRHEPPDHEEAR